MQRSARSPSTYGGRKLPERRAKEPEQVSCLEDDVQRNPEYDRDADHQLDDDPQRLRQLPKLRYAGNRSGVGYVQVAAQDEAGEDKGDQCGQAKRDDPSHDEATIPAP